MLLDRWKLLSKVMSDNRLTSASSLKVMFFLLNRENSKTKALFPSHARLAKDTNMSTRSVRRGIDELIAKNYLIKLKKGSPGRATSYQINYIHRTELSQKEDKIVVNIGTELSDQSTNKSINKSKLNNFINNITKNTHAGYKQVKEGKKKSYNSDEMVAQRILQKTNDVSKSEAYLTLKKSANWDDKVRAEEFAIHLGCLKK